MSQPPEHLPRSDDAAAYVLGALDESEAADFRAHADTCAICTAELERLRTTAAVLPLALPRLEAPRRLRRHVLAGARAERPVRAPAPARTPLRHTRFQLAGAGGLAAGLAIGALVIAPSSPSTSVIRASVASASVWHTARRPVAWLKRSGDRAELVVEHLPQAGSGKVYELWIERSGKPEQTDALFEPTSSGRADASVPGGVAGASAVLVTAEPRGGSRVPSMAPLITASLQD
jgi:hypothetical protein